MALRDTAAGTPYSGAIPSLDTAKPVHCTSLTGTTIARRMGLSPPIRAVGGALST